MVKWMAYLLVAVVGIRRTLSGCNEEQTISKLLRLRRETRERRDT